MQNFGSFLFQSEINTRKTLRLIVPTDNELINAELTLLFNETYKNILPRYTDIYIYILKKNAKMININYLSIH